MKSERNAITSDTAFSAHDAIKLVLDNVARSKPPIIQFTSKQQWRIWTSYNKLMTRGVYYTLHPCGSISRTILLPDDTEETLQVINTITPATQGSK